MTTTKGFLIYAHNNEEIDYGKIAVCCATMLKAHLKENKTCLVTDEGTLSYLKSSMGEDVISKAFDHIKVLDWTYQKSASPRRFLDTLSTKKSLTWYNGSRSSAYDLSPFDETIILDSDYLVQDSTFDLVWGNDEEVLINREALTLQHRAPKPQERRLESSSIAMFWATMVYFRKGEQAKMLFDLIEQVRENYLHYQYVYEFPGKNFRNDYAFSIAIHMLNGFLENNEFKPFPVPKILSSFDIDDLIEVRKDELIFLTNLNDNDWEFNVTRIKGMSVHVMNKYSILRHADKILELYRE